MSTFLSEEVPIMPPLSGTAIEALSNQFLQIFAPAILRRAAPLDLVSLVDDVLPKYGIFVQPASYQELGDRVGATDTGGAGAINVLIREDVLDQLYRPARSAHYARSTVAHELGHAIIHVPVIRQQLQYTTQNMLLARRVERSRIEPFRDPEWQAWMFAGCILMPRSALLAPATPRSIWGASSVFQVSEKMVTSHLRRMRLLEKFSGTPWQAPPRGSPM